MSDIVERLRNEKRITPPVFPHVVLCDEAADTIERLRADNDLLSNRAGRKSLRAYEEIFAENDKLRAALRNCHNFFVANNRPSYVEMIDSTLAEQDKE